jgi:hypothetical protein
MIRDLFVSELDNEKEKRLRQCDEETKDMQVKRFKFHIL